MDNPPDSPWLTLTEAAARTGHSREALRLRVRRGKLRAQEGRNDDPVRVNIRDLEDLRPPMTRSDHPVDRPIDQWALAVTTDMTLDMLAVTMDDLRTDLVKARTDLDKAQADRLVDHGRAERAEAHAAAEAGRAAAAEARLAVVEAALAEVRTPWAIRVIAAWRNRGSV